MVDAIAISGGVITVIAEIMSATETTGGLSWSEGGRILGVAVFLGGIIATLDQVMLRLQRLEESQVRVIESFRPAETSRSLETIDDWCLQNTEAVHVQAARDVATHLLGFVPDLVDDLEQFCQGAPATSVVTIEDQSPIHDLLANLARKLPGGGAWLGITLVEQESVWTAPDDAFSEFARRIRGRAGGGDIVVGRLYHFSAPAAEAALRGTLADEVRAGIQVRCLAGEPRQDMSLLYAPPEDERSRIRGPFGDDCVDVLARQGYRMICAVRFRTRADGVLRGATIYGPGHREAQVLERQYASAWRRAHACENAVDACGEGVARPAARAADAALRG